MELPHALRIAPQTLGRGIPYLFAGEAKGHSDEFESPLRRHARARRGHPRLSLEPSAEKTWMAGTSPARTPDKCSLKRAVLVCRAGTWNTSLSIPIALVMPARPPPCLHHLSTPREAA